jgi:hypothetical protein
MKDAQMTEKVMNTVDRMIEEVMIEEEMQDGMTKDKDRRIQDVMREARLGVPGQEKIAPLRRRC